MAAAGDDAPLSDAAVTLAAQVIRDEGKFVAAVVRLETADARGEPRSASFDGAAAGLEGIADTLEGAMDALALTMRGWLERQDTADQLGEALGLPGLEDDAEIILRFVVGDGDDDGGGDVLGAG